MGVGCIFSHHAVNAARLTQKVARNPKWFAGDLVKHDPYGLGGEEQQCSVRAMIEAENWRIALELYKNRPIPALLLAHQLMAIKQCLQRGEKGIPDVIGGLELAIDSLYPHTDFHKVHHRLFRRRLEGTRKPKQEEKLRQLRVRI